MNYVIPQKELNILENRIENISGIDFDLFLNGLFKINDYLRKRSDLSIKERIEFLKDNVDEISQVYLVYMKTLYYNLFTRLIKLRRILKNIYNEFSFGSIGVSHVLLNRINKDLRNEIPTANLVSYDVDKLKMVCDENNDAFLCNVFGRRIFLVKYDDRFLILDTFQRRFYDDTKLLFEVPRYRIYIDKFYELVDKYCIADNFVYHCLLKGKVGTKFVIIDVLPINQLDLSFKERLDRFGDEFGFSEMWNECKSEDVLELIDKRKKFYNIVFPDFKWNLDKYNMFYLI